MPKFIVNINLSKDKIPESFAGELTQQLSKALGKPAQYLAIQICPDQVMSFGGSTHPCAMCFLYSIGKIGEQENKVYSKLLCDLLNKQLKIPSNRYHVQKTKNRYNNLIPRNSRMQVDEALKGAGGRECKAWKDKAPGESLQRGYVCWSRSTLGSLQHSAPVNRACLPPQNLLSFFDISPGCVSWNNTTFS